MRIFAIEYVSDDGTRTSFTVGEGDRALREAREHARAGVCVHIEDVTDVYVS